MWSDIGLRKETMGRHYMVVLDMVEYVILQFAVHVIVHMCIIWEQHILSTQEHCGKMP